MSLLCILLICGGWHLSVASAAPVAEGLKANPDTTSADLPTAKSITYAEVRAALLAHVEAKAGSTITTPDFPTQKLLVWIDGRSAGVASDEKARYILLGEHLLIAQKLLESEDMPTRKQGYWIASESANFTAAKLTADKWLLARIYEAFLLPQVSLANVELWQDPSRSRILESAVSAFGNVGERDKQIRVLEWIISLEGKNSETDDTNSATTSLKVNSNTLDWARGTLGSLLFEVPNLNRPDLERSLALLQAIQSPDMKGFKRLQGRVQSRLDQLKEPETP